MTLDIVTLMAVGSFTAGLSALVLSGVWILMRDRALAWWAGSAAISSLAILFFIYGVLTIQREFIAIGAVLAAFGPALLWAGARAFSHRAMSLPGIAAGTVFIVLVTAVEPVSPAHLSARLSAFAVCIAYLVAASLELWNNGKEPLRARWALTILFALHGLTFLGGVADTFSGRLNFLGVPLTLVGWFGLIHIESLIFSMGTAVFMVVLCKERSELHLRRAASIDSLTGAMARGAFMAHADRLLAEARKNGAPLALILVDLDRFKSINDTFGHRKGDRMLEIFADSARACLRETDLFGRHGGEEFAILLPGATLDEGCLIADRIRLSFVEASSETDGGVAATLSAGIAALADEEPFEALIDKADRALYRAKSLGRNRIERAEDCAPPSRAIEVA